jgi:predicted Fe-Mo cluster-binding NifX family protein
MRICITATGPNLDSPVDPRFGRCQYFLVLDEKGELIKAIANEGGQAMSGAGVTAAQVVADSGVEAVITGNIGPNAYYVLKTSGIRIFPAVLGISTKEAFKMYINGKLKELTVPTGPGPGPGRRPGRGSGWGHGPGFGRGPRGGRGSGRWRRGFGRGQPQL